jgi:serine/threonine-protein kinase
VTAPAKLRDLDLSTIFASLKISPELPAEIFVGRATRRMPELVVDPTPAADPALPPTGSVLGGYRLDQPIGVGELGVVYRAREVASGELVAVKVMRPALARSRPMISRVLAEVARFAARIDHPNVVRVRDVAATDGHMYIVMDHVDGPDLAVMLRRKGALPARVVVRIVRHIAAGLAAGFAEQLIHRDVKPSNILLTRAAVTKLADFGLARATAVVDGAGVVGTTAYTAPEQITEPQHVDLRSDIYSLGVTAYHALTGRLPIEGPRGDLERAPSRAVAGVPAAFDQLIVAMTAPLPADRPASYGELLAALRTIR